MLTGPKEVEAELPALSVATPVAVDIPSALYTASGGQVAIPEPPSEQVKCTVTV